MQFLQRYDPLLSTLVAALPLITLLYLLAFVPWRDKQSQRHKGIPAPQAAGLATLLSFAIALFILKMPAAMAVSSFIYGSLTGLFPIGWILLAAMFLYTLTAVSGQFDVVKESITRVSADRRIQVLIIAFSLGASRVIQVITAKVTRGRPPTNPWFAASPGVAAANSGVFGHPQRIRQAPTVSSPFVLPGGLVTES